MDPVAVDIERKLWDSALSLVFAVAGSSAGLYSLFRLPLMFELFHPGAFLVALGVCLAVLAWPLMLVELAVGQSLRLAAIPALGAVAQGGRGVAFAAVLVGSLLTSAYASSALGVIASPGLSSVGDRTWPSTATPSADALRSAMGVAPSAPENGTLVAKNVSAVPGRAGTGGAESDGTFGEEVARQAELDRWRGDWYSVISLGVTWAAAALGSWAFIAHAPAFSRVMTPLPLVLWCAMAIFAAAIMARGVGGGGGGGGDRGGEGPSVRGLLFPTSESLWRGALWSNAAGQALLLLQVGTGMPITFGSKAKSAHTPLNLSAAVLAIAALFALFFTVACVGGVALLEADRNATAQGGNATRVAAPTATATTTRPTSSLTSPPATTSPATAFVPSAVYASNATGPSPARRGVTVAAPMSSVRWIARLLHESGDSARALGGVTYVVALVAGVLSITLMLNSFSTSMTDMHVSFRSPLVTCAAAAACFALAAPIATGAVPAVVVLALDQAVVGVCLPVLVAAESLCLAFGGWGGPSAVALVREIWDEDLSLGAKLGAGAGVLRSFSAARFRAVLGTIGGTSPLGRAVAFALPSFLKLVAPAFCGIAALVTIVAFASRVSPDAGYHIDAADADGAADAVFALVLVGTALALLLVALWSPPAAQRAPPWVETGGAGVGAGPATCAGAATGVAARATVATAEDTSMWRDDERGA
jgi:hypothetical protein